MREPDKLSTEYVGIRELHHALESVVGRREFDLRTVTVDESISKALAANALLVNSRFEASQEAIVKADRATEKRFDSVNEFRGQLADQARLYATRESLEAWTRESRTAHEILSTAINEQARTFVSRDTVDAQQKEVRALLDSELANLSILANRLSSMEGKIIAYAGSIGIAVTIFSVVTNLLIHTWK